MGGHTAASNSPGVRFCGEVRIQSLELIEPDSEQRWHLPHRRCGPLQETTLVP